jgi:dipeptidyl aminopeptidase/acylaminoacyl peptidase
LLILDAPIQARAAPPIEAYGALPGVETLRLSPSGDRYALIATVDEARRLVVATVAGEVLLSAKLGTTKIRSLLWAGEDHLLIFTSATVALGMDFTVSKHELNTVLVENVITRDAFQVFGRRHEQRIGNIVEGFYGTAQLDGHWYGWFGGVTYARSGTDPYINHTYPDLYRVDLDTGDVKMAAYGREDGDGWLVGADGAVAARALYNQKTGDWRLTTGSGETLASGNAIFAGVQELRFGRSPDRILALLPDPRTGPGGDTNSYRELPLSGGAENAVPDMGRMNEPLIDPATGLWIGQTLLDDSRTTVLFQPAAQARWRGAQKAFPGNIAHLVSWSADFNRLVVFTEGGADSGTYWLVDIAKHSADPLGSPYPQVRAADVGAVRMVDWRAADGLPLHGVLTLPPGREARALPLVVLPHGGPSVRDYPGFDWWAQAFASRGYAVFQPNFRGSGDYGAEFRDAGFGQWGRKMQTDISDGVAELARQGVVDPKRACIVGGSYGGYAALAGVTVQQGLYRCAVSVAGVADLHAMLIYDAKMAGKLSGATRWWKTFMGVDSASDDRLDAISPSALAARADAPILLIHGNDDTVVPFEQSEIMEQALKRAGKPVELVTMENEDHWLSRGETRTTMLTSAVAFVEKHNPPD